MVFYVGRAFWRSLFYRGAGIGGGAGTTLGPESYDQPDVLKKITGAVIIDGAKNTGTVYGDATLTQAAEVPTDVALFIPEGASLTIGAGRKLTNSGMISAKGTLTRNGVTHNMDDEITYADNITSYTIKRIDRRHSLSVTFIEESILNPFTDVREGDWFSGDVLYAYKNKLMLGTSETTFSPNDPSTLGMVVTVLYRMAGSPSIEDEIWDYPFADVDAEEYYGTAVYWARLNHIVDGYDSEHFGPTDAVTREQLATILYRFAQYMGYKTSAAMGMAGLDDAGKVSSYAVSTMQWACGSGLIQGGDGLLMPQGNAERCYVAAILHRFCERFAAK